MRCIVSLVLLLLVPAAYGYETDQFNNRLEPLEDSTEVLDERVNETIVDIVAQWRGDRDDLKFVNAIFRRIGGYHWVDKIERWAMKSDEVDRLSTPRRDSIYSGHPFWATRVIGLFGVGPTLKINGELVGSDKLGHFLSQGRKFYKRFLRYDDEAQAAKQSAFTERALFGQVTTGVYSNADLVANFEGYRFYRSLFEDDVISGKPAILGWTDGAWVIQRPFSFADHVNAYWDEALNVNHFDGLLYERMKERLMGYCPEFRLDPESFQVENESRLQEKYGHLQLRDTSELRLDTLCEAKSSSLVSQTPLAPQE